MKFNLLIVTLITVMLNLSLFSYSQVRNIGNTLNAGGSSSTGIALITANIVQPLGIVKSSDLSFGNIAAAPSAETVTISTDGNRIASGNVKLISTGTINYSAYFVIVGYPNATFNIILPTSLVIVSGNNQIIINNFESNLGLNSTLDVNGSAILKVGATLNLDPNQPSGLYTGSFDVVVAYN